MKKSKSLLELRTVGTMGFPAEGGTESLRVISQRVKYINGKEVSREVVDVSLRGVESWASYSKRQTEDGYIIDITLEENQGSYRGFDPEITQDGGKRLTFSIGQSEGVVSYDYIYEMPSSSFTFQVAERGKDYIQPLKLQSYYCKFINGKLVSKERWIESTYKITYDKSVLGPWDKVTLYIYKGLSSSDLYVYWDGSIVALTEDMKNTIKFTQKESGKTLSFDVTIMSNVS